MTTDDLFQEAVRQHQAGRLDQAAELYRKILAAQPVFPHATHYLGLIAFQQGHYADAVVLIADAIAQCAGTAPPEFEVNLGNALKRCDRPQEALAAYQRALQQRPGASAVWYNLAMLQKQLGDLAAEETSLQAACACPDALPQAWVANGERLIRRGDDQAALACFEKAMVSGSRTLEVVTRIGTALVTIGRFEHAVRLLTAARSANPRDSALLNALGCALSGFGRLTEAEQVLREARQLSGDDPSVIDNLAAVLKDAGRNDEARALYALALKTSAVPQLSLCSNYLMTLLYSDTVEPDFVAAEHRRYATVFNRRPDAARPVARRRPTPENPIRIGYLSADFHNHPVAYFMAGILEHHDPAAVTVFVYDNGSVADLWTARLQRLVPHWRAVTALDDDALAEQIQADRIDVLIDLSGHTADHRLAALSTRPATVQASYLGYPFSTGLPWIDWRIVDPISDPAGSESLAAERLYRLPRSYYAYSPPDDAPEVNPLPALKNGYLTFGVCANLAKVTPTTLDFWAALLRQHPDARLFWRAKAFADLGVRRRMSDQLTRRGIAKKRFTLEPWAAHQSRFSAYHQIDVALDTLPYNQATNTCEALWMGVPTVTLRGASHQANMGASIMQAAGLADWVFTATVPADFLADLAPLASLRHDLRQRLLGSALLDCPGAAKALEGAYDEMLKQQETVTGSD